MNQEPMFQISLPMSAVQAVLTGLQELPAKHSMPVLEELKRQIQPQIDAINRADALAQAQGAEPPMAANDVAAAAAEVVSSAAKKAPRRRRA